MGGRDHLVDDDCARQALEKYRAKGMIVERARGPAIRGLERGSEEHGS